MAQGCHSGSNLSKARKVIGQRTVSRTKIFFATVKQDKTLKENWGTIMATAVECCYNGVTGVVGGAGYVLSMKSTAAASKVKLLGFASGTASIILIRNGAVWSSKAG